MPVLKKMRNITLPNTITSMRAMQITMTVSKSLKMPSMTG